MAKRVQVFDFLYVDAPRIKSLISRLDEDGPLVDMTATDSKETDRESGLGGKLDLAVVELEASKGSRRSTGETVQRRYDVQYALPADLIDMLDEHDLVQRDTSRWRFGALAEFTGDMFLLDFASIHSGWEGIIKHASGLDMADEAAAMAIFASMPASVHAVFHRGATKVWSMLVLEHWLIPPQSVTLSLGSFVPGDWKIIGLVDAMPTKTAIEQTPPIDTKFAPIFAKLGREMKEMMGRADDCFGFTPILVYRTVTRKS